MAPHLGATSSTLLYIQFLVAYFHILHCMYYCNSISSRVKYVLDPATNSIWPIWPPKGELMTVHRANPNPNP
jgi:hypothetical protein